MHVAQIEIIGVFLEIAFSLVHLWQLRLAKKCNRGFANGAQASSFDADSEKVHTSKLILRISSAWGVASKCYRGFTIRARDSYVHACKSEIFRIASVLVYVSQLWCCRSHQMTVGEMLSWMYQARPLWLVFISACLKWRIRSVLVYVWQVSCFKLR